MRYIVIANLYRHFVNQKNSHWIVTLRRGLTVDTRYAIN